MAPTLENKTLENKKVVVVGGTSGIGLALIKMLSEDKASLIAIGRDPSKLSELSKNLPAVRAVAMDAGDRSALDEFFLKEKELDHLVITLSGAKGGGPFATLSLEDLRQGFECKFWPHLNTIQAALPYIRKGGSITLITAASSTAELPGTAGLAAINGALELMVPILSKELKPLRVNAVSPGVIDTPWWNFLPEEAKNGVFADFSSTVNIGRVGRPEEVASAIRMVITTEYINGTTIQCHGGLN
jgi:NAD(P)-dependent dehydrogenase (short-subunit alcohol dehydrogenase family)